MQQYSFLSKKLHKILISKITVFLSCTQDSQWATKRATMIPTTQSYRPKPSLHGLSHKKYPIKKYNNIILGWVIIRIKYNQTPQNSTYLTKVNQQELFFFDQVTISTVTSSPFSTKLPSPQLRALLSRPSYTSIFHANDTINQLEGWFKHNHYLYLRQL